MKRVVLLAVALALALAASPPGDAAAIDGPRAVRHLKRFVARDCHSYPGFRCLGWGVGHCYKLGWRKVRCHAYEQYMHNGNWRECRFNAVAVERETRDLVDQHFGYTRCYSASGVPIP